MNNARAPPGSGITPTRYPELHLDELWATMYAELLDAGNTRHASLKAIAEEYRTTASAVSRYVDPTYGRRSRQRNYQNQGREYQAHKADNARRMRARRHIEAILQEAYEQAEGPVDIRELTDLVRDVCGLNFRPKTILGLSHKAAETTGKHLLREIEDDREIKYVLR